MSTHRIEINPLVKESVFDLIRVMDRHLSDGRLYGGVAHLTMTGEQAQMLVDYFRDVGRPIEQWDPAAPGTEYIDGKKD